MRNSPTGAALVFSLPPPPDLTRRSVNNGRHRFGAAKFLDDGCSGFALHATIYALFAQLVKQNLRDNRTGLVWRSYAK